MKRRLIAILLMVCLVLPLFPISTLAASTATSGYCGESGGTNVSWSLDASGNLTITGTGRMEDYDYHYEYDDDWNESVIGSKPPWYDDIYNLKTITIGEGVTYIGIQAFQRSSAKTVTLPSTLTEIGNDAFCMSWVEQITLPAGLKRIGDLAFFTCSSLKAINIPASVTVIGEDAFKYCSQLTAFTVAAANSNYCSVDGVLFNKAKTELITYSCGNIRSNYDVPAGVKTIQSTAFAEANYLKTLTLPEGLKTIGGSAFQWTGLSELIIPTSVTTIGDSILYDCTNAKVYFKGNAPSVRAANGNIGSFPDTATLYYTPGTSGWTNSSAYDASKGTWNGYTLKVWQQDKKFTLGRDNNSFINSKEINGGFEGITNLTLDSEFYDMITKNASERDKSEIKKRMRLAFTGGACFGITATMGLVYDEKISLNSISTSDAKTYYELPRPCEDNLLKNYILFYHLSQYLSIEKTKFIYSLTNLAVPALLEAIEEDGIAIMTFTHGYRKKGSVLPTFSSHAVLATGLEEITPGLYKVELYDQNSVNGVTNVEYIYMTVWENVGYSFADANGIVLGYDINPNNCLSLSVIRLSDLYEATSFENSYGRIRTFSRNSGYVELTIPFNTSGTITSASGKTLTYGVDGFSGTMDILNTDVYVNEENSEWLLTVPYSESLTVECTSDTFGLSVGAENDFLSVEGRGIKTAIFTLGEGITLNEGLTGTYDFTAFVGTDVEVDENENNLIELSGTANAETKITYDAAAQQISAVSAAPLQNAAAYSLIRTDVTPISDLNDTENVLTVSAEAPTQTDAAAMGFAAEALLTNLASNMLDETFVDVSRGAYYYNAVQWAAERGIAGGVDAKHFAPDASCTRAQAVTMLYRAAGCPETTAENPFEDVSVNDYYYEAVLWAVANGITSGTDAAHFSPNAPCTRGQIVTFLHRAARCFEAHESFGFTDVKAGSYCEDAINWAVENSITNGTDIATFSPDAVCTRAQIVTFLYRNR